MKDGSLVDTNPYLKAHKNNLEDYLFSSALSSTRVENPEFNPAENKMKLFAQNHNNILNDVLPFYEKTKNLLEADIYLTWNDVVQPQIRMVGLAKEYGKRSIVMEHGMKGVEDYNPKLKDISNGMGGCKFIADDICVWGQRSKNIMLAAGVPENKIHVVGSPIIWDYIYTYRWEDKEVKTVFNLGQQSYEPDTRRVWERVGRSIKFPEKRESPHIVALFPGHLKSHYSLPIVQKVYDQLKHRSDVFVLLNDAWAGQTDDNPFLNLLKMEDGERRFKCFFIPVDRPHNIEFIKRLLSASKAAISIMPGTINGICWAMDVPVITPRVDWHWRDPNDEVIYDLHPGDYICELDQIEETLERVLAFDTKAAARKQCSIDFMGIDAGDPTENIRRVIGG